MYFDGDVDFNGDCLEVMEYRHDWASFRFTIGLIKFFLLGMIPEMLMHTRSQGTFSIPTPSTDSGSIPADSGPLQMRSRSVTTTTAVMISTPGSWVRA